MHLMNQISRVSAAALVGATLMLTSLSSHGLGFGRPISQATLGESLTLTVPLRVEASEDLTPDCVGAEVFFGDERLSDSSVQVSLLGAQSGVQSNLADQGGHRLRVTTSRLIHEPIITVRIKAGCLASMTRQFVVLADPPVVAAPAAPVSSATPMTPSRATSSASGSASASPVVPAASARSVAPRSVAQTTARTSTPAAAPVQRRARTEARRSAATPPATPTGAPPAESQPRLMLDPAGMDAALVPELRLSSTLDQGMQAEQASPEVLARREAAAALWRAMNAAPDEVVRDQQRVRELEQRLAQLQDDSQKAGEAVGTLRARLQELESQRSHSIWLYVLALVALAALVAAVYFHRQWRRVKAGREAAWWQSQIDESAVGAVASAETDLSHTSADFVHHRAEPESHDEAEHVAAASVSMASPAVPPAPPAVAHPMMSPVAPTPEPKVRVDAPPPPIMAPTAELSRAVTVEELIDLEQQADFFVVLGQDDAAIDLLENHVDGATAASPLPYLKLLEIYQRLGRRDDYERVQQAFNLRFNGYAPAWEADLQQGHRLDDYPGVIERLQGLWTTPSQAMEVLERSLTRPEEQSETFDLPAYRELLFLYAVARDLAEREQHQPPVDLLLSASIPEGVTPLMATRPIKAQPEARPDFTLDLHLDELELSGKSGPFTTAPLGGSADHEHIDLPDVSLSDPRR